MLAQVPDEVAVILDTAARSVDHELTSMTPIEHTDDDVALVALLGEIFDRVHREPLAIVLANLAGARSDSLADRG